MKERAIIFYNDHYESIITQSVRKNIAQYNIPNTLERLHWALYRVFLDRFLVLIQKL